MIDLDKIDTETLIKMEPEDLEALASAAHKLLDRIQEQLEWWYAPVGIERKRFGFKEGGPHFYAEAVVDGVLINPALPQNYDTAPHEERRDEERARWWKRPIIRTESWEEREKDMRRYRARQIHVGEDVKPEGEFESDVAELKASWLESWPSGKRYDVLCLDGGIWDGPSEWGMFATLEDALACIRERCE